MNTLIEHAALKVVEALDLDGAKTQVSPELAVALVHLRWVVQNKAEQLPDWATMRSGYKPDPSILTVPLDELKPTGTAVVRPDPIRLKPSELWMRLSPEERVALLDEACAADAIARECDEQIAALRAEVERWKTAYEGREKYEGTEEIVRKWTTDPLYAGETGASDVLHLCATVNRLHEQLDAERASHVEYVQCIHDYLHRYGVGGPGGSIFRQIVDDAERLRTRDSNLTAHDRNVMAVNEHLNERLKETQSRLEHLLSFLRGTEAGS